MPQKVMTDEVIERAVELRLQRWTWGATAKELGVAEITLKKWNNRPEWLAARKRVLDRLPHSLVELAALVLMKKLNRELGEGDPETTLALTIAERGLPTVAPPVQRSQADVRQLNAVIELPAESVGLESEDTVSVLERLGRQLAAGGAAPPVPQADAPEVVAQVAQEAELEDRPQPRLADLALARVRRTIQSAVKAEDDL